MLCAQWHHLPGQHSTAAVPAQTRSTLFASYLNAKLGTTTAVEGYKQFGSCHIYVAMADSSIQHKPAGQLPLVRHTLLCYASLLLVHLQTFCVLVVTQVLQMRLPDCIHPACIKPIVH